MLITGVPIFPDQVKSQLMLY